MVRKDDHSTTQQLDKKSRCAEGDKVISVAAEVGKRT